MFGYKTTVLVLASIASMQTLAAPVGETTSSSSTQIAPRDDSGQTLFSSKWDIDFCLWQSGIVFVGWSVLMKEFNGKSPEEMYSAVEEGLKGNSACNSYTLFQDLKSGVGGKNTTAAMTFNTDDFCTASQVSSILQKVSGRGDFHCSSNPDQGVDPDTSNVLAETMGSDGSEEPSEAKRSVDTSKAQSSESTSSTGASKATQNTAAPTKASSTSAVATGASKTAAPQATGSIASSDTAHPSGLADLVEAKNINGMNIPSVADMAAKLHMPSNATRAEVIEKLNDPKALDN